MRRRGPRAEIFGMNATSYRHSNARLRKRMIEFVIAFAFSMSIMAAIAGAVGVNASSHFSCTVHSIATLSDACSGR
jgi:hypothetical protein